jgi:hypothetical protein
LTGISLRDACSCRNIEERNGPGQDTLTSLKLAFDACVSGMAASEGEAEGAYLSSPVVLSAESGGGSLPTTELGRLCYMVGYRATDVELGVMAVELGQAALTPEPAPEPAPKPVPEPAPEVAGDAGALLPSAVAPPPAVAAAVGIGAPPSPPSAHDTSSHSHAQRSAPPSAARFEFKAWAELMQHRAISMDPGWEQRLRRLQAPGAAVEGSTSAVVYLSAPQVRLPLQHALCELGVERRPSTSTTRQQPHDAAVAQVATALRRYHSAHA